MIKIIGMIKRQFFTFFLVLFSIMATAGELVQHYDLRWQTIHEQPTPEAPVVSRLFFEGADYGVQYANLPVFSIKVPLENSATAVEAKLLNPQYLHLTPEELMLVDNLIMITPSIKIESYIAGARGVSVAAVQLLPFRLNMLSGKYEKLVAFDLELTPVEGLKNTTAAKEYVANSVLANGEWFRISVQETGIYKVTYEQLMQMGMNLSGVNSATVRFYGNGGGMLPEANSEYRPDDLIENAIQMIDGGDGRFDPGDYFLFYGQSPHAWKYNSSALKFDHQQNIYSDYTYYFITTSAGTGKRIATLPQATQAATHDATTFVDHKFHEQDNLSIYRTGRQWLGEVFDVQTTHDFNFSFPNIVTSAQHVLMIRAVAKSEASSSFAVSVNGNSVATMPIASAPETSQGDYAKDNTTTKRLEISGATVKVSLKYNKSISSSIGWLDYIELNVVRNLVFDGSQMDFRNTEAVGEGEITQFILQNAASGVTVWDVTSPTDAQQVQATSQSNALRFRLETQVMREFIAFDGSQFFTAEAAGTVANQNLHAQRNIDYIIVSHPDFMEQAHRLADFHRDFSNLTVLVTTPQAVYNEFSSGAQDITAIKEMMRMFYTRADNGEVMPRYLLLFGDASYDFKDRVQNNTNFVPTYESVNSISYTASFATDDYFGFLDPDESANEKDLIDIGIGRFVIATPEEAQRSVDKVIHYATSRKCMDDWRNVITFVGDDEEGNLHTNQADDLAKLIENYYPQYNTDKIYLDAYTQQTNAGGERYPEVNEAINSRIEKGTLVMNYTGHGGEVGWAHERVLQNGDINSWKNYDKMAVFITATCEFARYDDPGRTSAGEYVFLNPKGGGIALFTTARATYAGSNYSLNEKLYQKMFSKKDGVYYAMGDLIRLAKRESNALGNDLKFLLIGDPALKMAYPDYEVHTTAITFAETGQVVDTVSALSNVKIEGIVTDENGAVLSDFNGILHAIVYDKESVESTLGQDETSQVRTFKLRKNVIYKGQTEVMDGVFSFTFIVPVDIAYNYGSGKISYFAEDGVKTANGYDFNLIVGGFDGNTIADKEGPEIDLYMNDTSFRWGDITNQNPMLLAHVFDRSGINTVGNSIGHDITAVLDGNSEKPFKLNDYYESDAKGYTSGTVRFAFSNLEPGEHMVTFRVWDILNNSSDATLKFVVVGDDQIIIRKIYNRPNPLTAETWFEYNHNQANEPTEVKIEIYDLSGRLMTTLYQNNQSDGFYAEPIRWDGTTDSGQRLGGGVYVYRVQIKDEIGRTASAVNKLVIAR
jgi:hypothetical protein